MSSPPISSLKYYFDTDTFIEIVLELELYLERAPPPDAEFLVDDTTDAIFERWQELFGLTEDEIRNLYNVYKDDEKKDVQLSEVVQRLWP
jgi:hypothetical protein